MNANLIKTKIKIPSPKIKYLKEIKNLFYILSFAMKSLTDS